MKHLKLFEDFKLNEEIDIDSGTDNKMREANDKMTKGAKKLEAELTKLGLKFVSKNTTSEDEYRKLRAEALEKIKAGDDKMAYGIMKWTQNNDICQSFTIVVPEKGIEFLRQPIVNTGIAVSYKESPQKWATIDIYNSPGGKGQSKSLYMEVDGEVLYQWDDYENKSKGKLSNKMAKHL